MAYVKLDWFYHSLESPGTLLLSLSSPEPPERAGWPVQSVARELQLNIPRDMMEHQHCDVSAALLCSRFAVLCSPCCVTVL